MTQLEPWRPRSPARRPQPPGFLDKLLPGRGERELARRHEGRLDAMDRELELSEERFEVFNEAGRSATGQLLDSARVRDLAMQHDPAGAQMYAGIWMQVGQASIDEIRRLTRRVRQ